MNATQFSDEGGDYGPPPKKSNTWIIVLVLEEVDEDPDVLWAASVRTTQVLKEFTFP